MSRAHLIQYENFVSSFPLEKICDCTQEPFSCLILYLDALSPFYDFFRTIEKNCWKDPLEVTQINPYTY